MPKQSAPLGRAEAIATRIAQEMGYTLVDAEFVKESAGRFLRFFIDQPAGVTLNDCESFHRRIQPLMDDIDYDFLEVSSPGADRPLKKDADFACAMGAKIEIKLYAPRDGKKRFVGILSGYGPDHIEIETQDGENVTFHRQKDVALAVPVIEFDESELKRILPDEE